METREWMFPEIRENMPPGPWMDEPDKAQWRDAATGLPCLMVRQPRSGHLCGYVGVPDGHPLYGRDYTGLYEDVGIYVHGGLTFAARCHPVEGDRGICHIAPGEDDVWWFGFDCAHAGDRSYFLKPELSYGLGDGEYRTFAYVKNECANLAAQLKAAT